MEPSRGLFSFPTGKTVSFRRAFATQYIAIILIVLTFVIGTFARNKLATRQIVQTPPQIETRAIVEGPESSHARTDQSEEECTLGCETELQTLPVVRNPPSQFVGVFKIRDIFENDSDILRPSTLQGLILALKNHDLNAKIDVFVESSQPLDSALQLAVSRTISLQKFLKREGVSPQNFEIFANPKEENGGQRVALYRSNV